MLNPKQLDLSKDIVMSGGNIYLNSGSASTPALLFSDHTNTGIYLVSNGKIGISTSGVQRLYINTAAVSSNLQVRSITGSASSPSYAFNNAINTGIFLNTGNNDNVSNSGTIASSLNPALSLSVQGNTALTINNDLNLLCYGTGAIKVPTGAGNQKPSPASAGMLRFNTDNSFLEGFDGNNWYNIPFVNRDITTLNVITITNDYITTEMDYYILVNAMAKNIEISLIQCNPGMTFVIKKTDTSSNKFTIIPPTGTTIDSYDFYSVSNQNDTLTITTDGVNWFIVGKLSNNIT